MWLKNLCQGGTHIEVEPPGKYSLPMLLHDTGKAVSGLLKNLLFKYYPSIFVVS